MTDPRKQKLTALGVEALADALLNLAVHFNEADDLIEQLIATPEENVQRFKKKLSNLKHSRRFIDWRETFRFSCELKMLLRNLKSSVHDPLTGAELVASFYETDNTVFEMCDDSDGDIGDVFYSDAKKLFVEYASLCDDKEKIADIILMVNREDNYDVRDTLIECAGECLPENVIRTMIATLQKRADKEKNEYDRRRHLRSIESLAKQIKDAKLFEKMRIALLGELNSAAMIDIAQIYLESGEVKTALSWLKKIPEGETLWTYERDKLLEEVYRKQGNSKKLTELLYQKFRSYYSTDTLQALLNVIGLDKRDDVISDAALQILKTDELRVTDAEFLIAVGKIDEAEQYLLERADHLAGRHHASLLSLAEAMEAENRHLVTTLIYRSLLISVLESGYTAAYPDGVFYLKKLDELATSVSNWKEFNHHEAFKAQIIETYGRKRSFWSKYKVKEK